MSWVVVVTRPGDEAVAEQSIERAGHVAFVPRYRKTLRGARIAENGRRIRARGHRVIRRPLLPGYLFVQLNHDESEVAVLSAIGVTRILHTRLADRSRGPAYFITDTAIERIRAEVESGRWDQVDLLPGDKVRLSAASGVLAGLICDLISLDGAGQARVMLLDLFGRDVATTVPADALQAVVASEANFDHMSPRRDKAQR